MIQYLGAAHLPCKPQQTARASKFPHSFDAPPYRAYPVTGGITFTYGGVKISERAAVLDQSGNAIPGLFACGEMVGGVFQGGYPGGSGLTSGAVFGRLAGIGAVGNRYA